MRFDPTGAAEAAEPADGRNLRAQQSPTVAPPVDASNPYAGRSLAELEAVMQSEEYRRPAPVTGSHPSTGSTEQPATAEQPVVTGQAVADPDSCVVDHSDDAADNRTPCRYPTRVQPVVARPEAASEQPLVTRPAVANAFCHHPDGPCVPASGAVDPPHIHRADLLRALESLGITDHGNVLSVEMNAAWVEVTRYVVGPGGGKLIDAGRQSPRTTTTRIEIR